MKTSFVARRLRVVPRAVLFRVGAVFLGLIPFFAIEVLLRSTGWDLPSRLDDPFVGFSSVRPLFVRSEAGDRWEIARSRQSHFVADSFAAQKRPDEFRVFCIGDSTVQGSPWSTETSFTRWLEISLNAAEPARDFQVINCGGISYASYRMVPILEEVLEHQPDLVIVHCSHNEFLEDRTYGDLKRIPRWLWRLHEHVGQWRLYNLLSLAARSFERSSSPLLFGRTSGQSDGPRPVLPAEVAALLDDRGGLECYHHDPEWHRGVIAHFEVNLRRMTATARRARVPLILLNPACQLRNSPPFKAEHRAGLSMSDRRQWDELWTEARSHYAREPRRAAQLLREAVAIDVQHAGLHYDLAKCYEALGQFANARSEYVRAKDLDVCPLRILESMNEIVRQVGLDTRTPVVDLGALFYRISRDGIPGADWFADHVHPTIPGYQRIADEITDELVQRKVVAPELEWQARKQQRYAEHFASLPTSYFVRGQQRLESLMLWAHGRATRRQPP